MRNIAIIILAAVNLAACSVPTARVFPSQYPPVFSPSAAGGECSAVPYTGECQMKPTDVEQ